MPPVVASIQLYCCTYARLLSLLGKTGPISAGSRSARNCPGGARSRGRKMQALPLKALSPDGGRRKIVVRLSRIWEAKNRDTGHVYELAFAAVDHEGTVMEGNVPAISMAQFKDVLKEGTVYTIQGFMVKPARGKYRTVDNDHRITMTQYTKVEQAVPEPIGIPLVAYCLQPLPILEKRARSVVVLSDVLGVVTDMTGLILPKGQGQARRNIKIRNIDGDQFTVTLWGHQAENFDEESVRASSAEGSVAILFVSMAVDYYLAKLCFKGTSLTRVYINIPIPEISALRARYGNEPNQVQWHEESSRPNPVETTVSALYKQERDDVQGNYYKIPIEITEVDDSKGWWFWSCDDCWKTTKPNGTTFRCTGVACPCIGGTERYRINVKAKDINYTEEDEEKIGCFTFFGTQGKILTGYDAKLVIGTAKGRPDYLPPAIANVVGRKYLVTARVNQEIYEQDNIPFRVSSTELIGSPAPPLQPASNTNLPVQVPSSSSAKEVPAPSEGNADSIATPPADAVETLDSHIEKVVSTSSAREKRKNGGGTTASKAKKALHFPGTNSK